MAQTLPPTPPVNHGYYKTRIAVIGIICIVIGAFLWAALSETVLKLKNPTKNQPVKTENQVSTGTNQPTTGNSSGSGSTPRPSQPTQSGQTTQPSGTGTPSSSTGSSAPGSSGTPSTPAPATTPTSPTTNTPPHSGSGGGHPLVEATSTPVLTPSPTQPSRTEPTSTPPSRTGTDPSASGSIGL